MISLSSCKSIFAGIFLLLVSGLHVGWAIWRVEVREPWVSFTNFNVIIFIMMSWYMFAIVGGIIGAVMVTKMRKKFIYVSQTVKNLEKITLTLGVTFLILSILVVSYQQ